jgi:hypothetical protein
MKSDPAVETALAIAAKAEKEGFKKKAQAWQAVARRRAEQEKRDEQVPSARKDRRG